MTDEYKLKKEVFAMNDFMDLVTQQHFTAQRASSYDTSGGNADAWTIWPGETKVIADIRASGIIKHIWFTIGTPDSLYLRKLLIKMYWDGETEPSVLCPVGDFFGLGHARPYTYSCAAFSCSTNTPGKMDDNGVAMNCWLPMPFKSAARIEITNDQDTAVGAFYFYIDWQKHNALPDDILYFHAQWRRENPARVLGDDSKECRDMLEEAANLTDKYNYLLLNATGKGHFIGVNLSIDNLIGDWWGEGDDMFFIDRDEGNDEWGGNWPPELHGTGSEDYLCHAWGMQRTHGLYTGEPWCERTEDEFAHHSSGKVCVYRHHLLDPVPFTKKLRVSIEHGHANDRENDIASTAYWYQDEPHKVFEPILPVAERLPR